MIDTVDFPDVCICVTSSAYDAFYGTSGNKGLRKLTRLLLLAILTGIDARLGSGRSLLARDRRPPDLQESWDLRKSSALVLRGA